MNYSLKHSNRKIFYITAAAFLMAWPISFYGFEKHKNIDLTTAFTTLFIAIAVIWGVEKKLYFRSISKEAVFVLSLFLVFSAISLLNGTPLYEVTVGTKPLILFFFLFFSIRRAGLPYLPQKFSIHVIKITCFLMFVKYSLSLALGLNDRPYLFAENNFELVLPLAVLFCLEGKSLRFTCLLILLIVMSGSKSAILSLVLVPIIYAAFRARFLVGPLVLVAIGFFAFAIVNSGLVDQIDRVLYLTSIVSFYDISLLNVFFGNFQIGALHSDLCETLSYMGPEKVTFDGQNYVCFSRVVNFTSIRLFMDFGLIFAALFFFCWFLCLRRIFIQRDALILFLIGFLNGLSVSGFGNIFYFLTILLLYSFSEKRHWANSFIGREDERYLRNSLK